MRKIYLEEVDLKSLDEKEKRRLIDFCEKNIINLNTFLKSIENYEHCYNLVLKIPSNIFSPSPLVVYLNHLQSSFIIYELDKLMNLYSHILKEINPNTKKINFKYSYNIEYLEESFLKVATCFTFKELKDEYEYIKMLSKKALLSDYLILDNYISTDIKTNHFFDLSILIKTNSINKDIISSISGNCIFTLKTGSIYSAIHKGLELYYCFLKDNCLS